MSLPDEPRPNLALGFVTAIALTVVAVGTLACLLLITLSA